jgi:hypothetical protein
MAYKHSLKKGHPIMTSTKFIMLGFLFSALGFGFLLLALTGVGTTPNSMPANLFVSYPAEGNVSSYVIVLGNAVRAEQGVGLAFLAIGFIVGAIGCFRRD